MMIMGDPRKLRNKYESPRKVWDAERIKRDKGLTATYGLKNTREIWVALRELKKARSGGHEISFIGRESRREGKALDGEAYQARDCATRGKA